MLDGSFAAGGFAETANLLSPVATVDATDHVVEASTRNVSNVLYCTVQRWNGGREARCGLRYVRADRPADARLHGERDRPAPRWRALLGRKIVRVSN